MYRQLLRALAAILRVQLLSCIPGMCWMYTPYVFVSVLVSLGEQQYDLGISVRRVEIYCTMYPVYFVLLFVILLVLYDIGRTVLFVAVLWEGGQIRSSPGRIFCPRNHGRHGRKRSYCTNY